LARRLDVEDGDAQVAVVGDGERGQPIRKVEQKEVGGEAEPPAIRTRA